jgi:hypothetical protein
MRRLAPPSGRMSTAVTSRRFPPRWSVEETDACIVRDANAQALASLYFEDEPGVEPPRTR